MTEKDPTPEPHPLTVFKALSERAQAMAYAAALGYKQQAAKQEERAEAMRQAGRNDEAGTLRTLATRNRHREKSAIGLSDLSQRLADAANDLRRTEQADPDEPPA